MLDRASLLVTRLAVLVCAAIASVVVAAVGAPAAPGGGKPAGAGPVARSSTKPGGVTAADRAVVRAARERDRALKSPQARKRRKVSRLAFRNRTGRQARRLAQKTFPDVAAAKPYVAIGAKTTGDAGSEADVVKYENDFTAVVQNEPGTRKAFSAKQLDSLPGVTAKEAASAAKHGPDTGEYSVVESTVPLRTRAKKPVDLSLATTRRGFKATEPVVPATFPEDLDDGFTLGDRTPLTVTPVATAGEGVRTKAGVFYANALNDTDVLLKPNVWGTETFHVLRSAASPEKLSFEVDLSGGKRLVQRKIKNTPGTSWIEVLGGNGKRLATVHPPLAWDADGTEVPVRYSIAGDTITMHVAHRSRDLRYPLMVDPTYEYWGWNGTSLEDRNGWWYRTLNDGCGSGFQGVFGNNWYTRGWRIDGAIVHCQDWAAWGEVLWAAPRQSYIYGAQWLNVNHPWRYTCANQTLYKGGVWPPTQDTSQLGTPNCGAPGEFGTNPWVCVSGTWPCDPNYGSGGNYASAWLRTCCVAGTRNPPPYMDFGGAQILLNDRDNPAIEYTGSNSPSGWIKNNTTLGAGPRAHDNGLGVSGIQVQVPKNGGGYSVSTYSANCGARCGTPWSTSFTYDTSLMPDGKNTVYLYAYDAVYNWSPAKTWEVWLDRAKPTVSASGSLLGKSGQSVEAGPYDLNITASDATSGVASANIMLRGPQGQTIGTWSGNPSKSFTFDAADYMSQYGFGTYTISYWADDNAGNQADAVYIPVTVNPQEANRHIFYKQFGSRNLINKETNPSAAHPEWDYHYSDVGTSASGAIYNRLLDGGAVGDLNYSGRGEYCNSYVGNGGVSPLTTTVSPSDPNGGDWSPWTGINPGHVNPDPPTTPGWKSWTQIRDGGQSGGENVCQEWASVFGSRVKPNRLCEPLACGGHHWVSFGPYQNRQDPNESSLQYRAYPWSSNLPSGAELRIRSNYSVKTYSDQYPQPTFGWAYTCALLVDTTSGTSSQDPYQYLELCVNKWQPRAYAAPNDPYDVNEGHLDVRAGVDCAELAPGSGTVMTTVWQAFPSRRGAAAWWKPISGATVTNGLQSLGTRHTIEFALDYAGLQRAIAHITAVPECDGGLSTNPAVYRLVGVEDGLEGVGNFTAAGFNSNELKVWSQWP